MKSEVDFTVGFSCSSVATGTPDWAEITPKVSPAFTIQYRFVAACDFDEVVVVGVETDASVGGEEVRGGDGDPPVSSPERISTTAIVTASRNAAGAA